MKLITTIIGILITQFIYSQIPKRMSFQAVIRNSNNDLVVNSNVSIRISIIKDSASGSIVYNELHQSKTNSNGLVSIEIGGGNILTGNIDSIKWGESNFYIQSETDPLGGNNYVLKGITQMLSVPYAFYAENSKNPGPKGDSGKDGVGINSTKLINDSLIIEYSNGLKENAGKINNNDQDMFLIVDQFGAKKDDINFDNSSIIQKVIDSALISGKIIYFGKGRYYIFKTLYIRKFNTNEHDEGIKIIGSGIDLTKIISKVQNGPLIVMENALQSNQKPIPGYFFKGGYIKNIMFESYGYQGNCLQISGWWYGLLENIQIRGFNGHGIHMPTRNNFGPPNDPNGNAYTDNYSSFITIKNSQIDNNAGWGYFDEKENTSSDLVCEKSVFASNQMGGIRFGGQSIRLLGCAIAYNGFGPKPGGGLELGINGNSSHNNFISQIEFDGNNQYHIKMNSTINTTITQSRFLFHDLIDSSKMTPYQAGILLAADSLYPYANNINITNNYIRIDNPTKAIYNKQNLFFVKFLSHASTINIHIKDNFFQSLPAGFKNIHQFTRYDYYFDSRLGITNNIEINDHDYFELYNSTHGKNTFYIDGYIKNNNIDTTFSDLQLNFPITYGGYNQLNLNEYINYYDTTNHTVEIPQSGYYEIDLQLHTELNTNKNKIVIQYYYDQVLNETHYYSVIENSEQTTNDKLIKYFSKGVKVKIQIKSQLNSNLSGQNLSHCFIKLIN